MAMSNYLIDKLYDHILRNISYTSPASTHLALFTTMPTAAGTGGVEVVGGSYARQAFVIGNPALGDPAYNSTLLTFPAMPACVVKGCGIYDAATVGNMLFFGMYSTPRTVLAGTPLNVLIGDISVVLR